MLKVCDSLLMVQLGEGSSLPVVFFFISLLCSYMHIWILSLVILIYVLSLICRVFYFVDAHCASMDIFFCVCCLLGKGGGDFVGTFLQNFEASALSLSVMSAINDISFTCSVGSCCAGIIFCISNNIF